MVVFGCVEIVANIDDVGGGQQKVVSHEKWELTKKLDNREKWLLMLTLTMSEPFSSSWCRLVARK